ncbi:MAG: DUF979 domain-containing protein [Lachnospiraceae bacterium]|nr:DUF979 domain-containing protein [Lachnospiraceae bacterium]
MINTILSEIFYCLIGVIFILVGIRALKDETLASRSLTAAFWFLLAAIFMVGPYLPQAAVGASIVVLAVLTGLNKVKPSKGEALDAEQGRKEADRLGNKIFVPVVCLAGLALLAATFLPFGANNAIGISGLVCLVIVFAVTGAPAKAAANEGSRLMDSVGITGILPQLLAALGAVFTAAGVGDVISGAVSVLIPEGNMFIAVLVYCAGMALFTMIMGNGFAAFSVITVGIGMPFLIAKGANPAVVGALGLSAGYCGTLVTPMAANFNIMPAALLEMRNKYGIIKAQAVVAAVMFALHVAIMYFWAL